jgi:competence protein ComEC
VLRWARLHPENARPPGGFGDRQAAQAEDSCSATVVVSLERLRRSTCAKPTVVIDRFDLWRAGGHALWLRRAGVRVERVAKVRGQRPWIHLRLGSQD